MKVSLPRTFLLLCMGVVALAGCASNDESSSAAVASREIGASLSLASALTSAATVNGVDLTLMLPDGVVPTLEAGEVALGVVTLGVGTTGLAVNAVDYTPATAETLGSLHIVMIAANGFSTGEFLHLNLNITTEQTPDLAKFTIPTFFIYDAEGVETDVAGQATVSAVLY